MGKNQLKNPLKNFKTKVEESYIHGQLFKATYLVKPMYTRNEILGTEHSVIDYKLNLSRYKDLLVILKRRKASSDEWDLVKAKNWGETPKEIKKILKAQKKYLTERDHFKTKLDREFEYNKLVQSPEDEPSGWHIVPLFDLQYVLRDKDLKKWAHVIRLELEYRKFIVPKRGNPKKESVYTREVFLTFEEFLAEAIQNKKKIELNPVPWAADKTVEYFLKRDNSKISAKTLIRLAKSRDGKKLDKVFFTSI